MNRAELIATILTSKNRIDVLESDAIVQVVSERTISSMAKIYLKSYDLILNRSPARYTICDFYLEISSDNFILGNITRFGSVLNNRPQVWTATFISYEVDHD